MLIEDTFDATIETMHQSITWDSDTRLYYGTSGVTEASPTKNRRFGRGPRGAWMILDVFPAVLCGLILVQDCLSLLKYVLHHLVNWGMICRMKKGELHSELLMRAEWRPHREKPHGA